MLDRVTITGADDTVAPSDIVALSQKYPFVEWGILASKSQVGSPRFPSAMWIDHLQRVSNGRHVKLCLHLCGAYVRALLMGQITFPKELLDGFDRVQLNFHAERVDCDRPLFVDALRTIGADRKIQFIFQIDGADGNKHFDRVLFERGELVDVVPLFDTSGGAGVLPDVWPVARYGKNGGYIYHGYAGGLGPDNLVEQLPQIAVAAGSAPYWIDMETRVRTVIENYDDRFDLDKVETALRIADSFVSPVDAYSRRA